MTRSSKSQGPLGKARGAIMAPRAFILLTLIYSIHHKVIIKIFEVYRKHRAIVSLDQMSGRSGTVSR